MCLDAELSGNQTQRLKEDVRGPFTPCADVPGGPVRIPG